MNGGFGDSLSLPLSLCLSSYYLFDLLIFVNKREKVKYH